MDDSDISTPLPRLKTVRGAECVSSEMQQKHADFRQRHSDLKRQVRDAAKEEGIQPRSAYV